jgi:hypothetical protein
MLGARLLRRSLGYVVLGAVACSPPPAPPRPTPVATTSQEPARLKPPALEDEVEPSAIQLRSGRIAPVDHKETLALKVRRHAIDGDDQLLELVLPQFAQEAPGDQFWLGTEARITGSSAPLQLVSRGKDAEMVLFLRRPKLEASGEIAGDAYTPAVGGQPGHHFRFRAPAPTGAAAASLVSIWAQAFVDHLSSRHDWFGYSAIARIRTRYKLTGHSPFVDVGSNGQSLDLVELMDTFSGRAAVQAALATRRQRVLSVAKAPRTLPIASVKPPELTHHPWAELSKRLSVKPPEEPLARAVPADFYFVRASSFGAFTQTLDFVETFGGPAADLLDDASAERATLPRYLAELGVESSDLSRVLGPDVIWDFAVAGSDPYLHQGSDVTLIFRLKSPLLFRAALSKALATHGAAHGGTQNSNFTHEGVLVDVARSPDGRVRQHRASTGDFELVSNSPAAIKRVISTIIGKAPRLADEADFRYMLARDADVPADILAFIGDRFVETVVGPAQKIAEARRQVALSELTEPPIAALIHGWIHGKSPLDSAALVRSGLLAAGELRHQDGARIEWAPGAAPRSSWGSPATLEPLIDLPAVTKVSVAERDSYARFAEQYRWRWSQYVDPIALRLSQHKRGGGTSLHAEMRVLPLVPADQAAKFDLGGDGHIAPSELASGVRFSMGIGQNAELRRTLTMGLGWLTGGDSRFKLDWLGSYAMVGAVDRNELLPAVRRSAGHDLRELERPLTAQDMAGDETIREGLEDLQSLPVYAAIGLKSKVAVAVALTAARRKLEESAPGAVEWGPFAEHRGVQVVRIVGKDDGQAIALYYAIAADSLLITFNRSVMRTLIEQAMDGKLPDQSTPAAKLAKEGQVVLELAPNKKGALRTIASWLVAAGARSVARRARLSAEVVLRGVPESAHKADRSAELLRLYLGSSPVSPDGRRYFLSPEGIVDPVRGTAHAPEWPAIPTPGSSVERVLAAFGRVRSDLSFDEEPELVKGQPRLRSLRARVDLWLR